MMMFKQVQIVLYAHAGAERQIRTMQSVRVLTVATVYPVRSMQLHLHTQALKERCKVGTECVHHLHGQ